MAECPTCHQPVDAQALECPYCRTALKAYGHAGIPLHRAAGKAFLCDTCVYQADDSCNFAKRPYAKDCTLYRDRNSLVNATSSGYTTRFKLQTWFKRNFVWFVLAGLILLSLLIALAQ